MPKYHYKAMNMSGSNIEGIYEGSNKQAVVEMIRQKSFYPLEIKEVVERKEIEITFLSKIKSKDISLFCKQFASILKAGVPLIQCLNMLSEQTENKGLKNILKNVSEEIQKGSSLSQAMTLHEKKLPSILINMVRAGEVSGTLDDSLELMAVHFEKENKLNQKVKSAMMYPIVISVVAVAVVCLLLIKVVPMFATMFTESGAKLPGPTKMLIDMSDFLKENGLIVLSVIIVIGIMIKLFLSGESGRLAFHKSLLKLPLIGKFQIKTIAARFARTLATLMSTGVSITEALEITGRVVTNTYARNGLRTVEEQVKQGKGLYEPIKSLMIFPPMIQNMIMLGEQSGTLDHMLLKAADFYEEEVDREVQNLTSLMEPAIIVVLGGIIGFIVLSIALPMFSMANFAA